MKKLDDFNKLVDSINPEEPLDETSTKYVMAAMFNRDGKLSEIVNSDDPELKKAIGVVAMLKRLEILSTVKMTFGVALIMSLFIRDFGCAVMYAYYIHRKLKPNTIVDLDVFSKILFPWGTFSKKQLDEIWNSQKLTNENEMEEAKPLKQYGVKDNLLDYILTWEKENV